jgi:MoaA/NifB/PqqE/SkfB family radical SAM enzyme
MLHANGTIETDIAQRPLTFLWLELTNRCNLQCTHCYAESGPRAGAQDVLQRSDYERLMTDAAAIGCRQIQFIGGEPTLNPDLVRHIEFAVDAGYTFIEVFSNLTRLEDRLITCFKTHGIHVATSVYAAGAETHDDVTKVRGSFTRTITNVRRLLDAQIPVRAGVIEMEQNAGQTAGTVRFLREIGVPDVRTDRLRQFGRAAADTDARQMSELCGSCAGGTVCVAPDGRVSPCIMSKKWSVGDCRTASLGELVTGPALRAVRDQIHTLVVAPRQHELRAESCGPCTPCSPDVNCNPCPPNTTCPPNQCPPYCVPNR